jgi:hypothetical protein
MLHRLPMQAVHPISSIPIIGTVQVMIAVQEWRMPDPATPDLNPRCACDHLLDAHAIGSMHYEYCYVFGCSCTQFIRRQE